MKSKLAAGKAAKMGYTNAFWYKDGMVGWKESGHFLEMEDFSYRTRRLPEPVSPASLKAKLKKGGGSVVLVDIRGDKSRKSLGSIEGASMHVPIYALSDEFNKLPREKNLVLYDIRGKQASSAVRFLLNERFSFSRISWLEGGFEGWSEKGYPVQR